MQAIKEYWRIILAGGLVLLGGAVIQLTTSQQDALAEQEVSLTNQVSDLELQLKQKPLTEDDLAAEVTVIEQSSSQARDMGAEMIQIQRTMAGLYRQFEPLDPDTDMTPVRDAEKAYTRLTGSTDYGNTWLLNPTWTMELDTVANYAGSTDVPVVFSMYTKDKKLAGLVRAIYLSDEDLLEDVSLDYTVDGNRDAADVGGK